MSSPSKKAARASLILVLGATSAIPAVAALTSNDQPPVVIASAASAGSEGPKARGMVIKAVRDRAGAAADGGRIAAMVKARLL